jgi:hypothetical protein
MYGFVALSGMIAGGIATLSKRFSDRTPYALIAAVSSGLHALVISPVAAAIGVTTTLTLALVAVGVAVAFALVMDRALNQPRSGRATGGNGANATAL